jgi:glycosyltransferase involved in cell wall biosynthesis
MKIATKENTAIIVPAFNAEPYLEELFAQILAFSDKQNIIVVNDGSIDKTSAICQKNEIHCLDFPHNCGKGFALRKGFQKALQNGYEFAFTIDSDLQHPPVNMPDFWQKQNKTQANIVIGKRDFSLDKMPFMRICSNTITSFILQTITGKKIEDSQCGYRIYYLPLMREMEFRTRRYQFETEIIFKFARRKADIRFVPIPTIYQGEKSYISHVRDICDFIKIVIYETIQNVRKNGDKK